MNNETDLYGRTYNQDGVRITTTIREVDNGRWRVTVYLQHLPVLVEHTFEYPLLYDSPEEAREAGEAYARAKIANVLSAQQG